MVINLGEVVPFIASLALFIFCVVILLQGCKMGARNQKKVSKNKDTTE